jgi:hypothetical protein
LIDAKILFIVGAGASTEFGLPTGRTLLEKIATVAYRQSPHSNPNVQIPEDVRNALMAQTQEEFQNNWVTEFTELLETALWISRNAPLAPSIDNLLHSHRGNSRITQVGKLLIAHCLLEAEKNSVLMPISGQNEDAFEFLRRSKKLGPNREVSGSNSWLSRLFWLLAEESSFDDFLLKLKKINFVCFNYDRCIEHYLVNAAISYFQLDEFGARTVLEHVSVIHPYGTLGDIRIFKNMAVGYGQVDNILDASFRIRTFTEGAGKEGIHNQVKNLIEEARFIGILGFGFLQLNLDLLFNDDPIFEPSKIAATSLGLSTASRKLIGDYFRTKHHNGRKLGRLRGDQTDISDLPIEFVEVGCSQMLDHYHHVLRKL